MNTVIFPTQKKRFLSCFDQYFFSCGCLKHLELPDFDVAARGQSYRAKRATAIHKGSNHGECENGPFHATRVVGQRREQKKHIGENFAEASFLKGKFRV